MARQKLDDSVRGKVVALGEVQMSDAGGVRNRHERCIRDSRASYI